MAAFHFTKKIEKGRRVAKGVPAPTLESIRGLSVFLDGSLEQSPHLAGSLERKGMTCVDCRSKAAIILVNDPANPGRTNLWRAVLSGCTLATQAFILHQAGPVVIYTAAVRTPRKVWITDAFRRDHAQLWDLMQEVKRQKGRACKWQWLGTEAEYDLARARFH